MYTEERKGNLLKQFLIKLILIIIFILLLIWLVPWPNMDSYIDAINPLKDQIFNENIQTMKDSAITYFTTERLPQNVGDVKKITLQEMLDMKLLIPFTDRNGKSCDVKKSYVSLEKMDTEYLMKVNLKCGEEENYILVHLGCYSYCSTDICEQRTNPVTYICKYVDGKYYDANGKVTTKEGFNKSCTTPTVTPKINPRCAIQNGTYYDDKGNVTNYDGYKKACVPAPTPKKHICEVLDGRYYGANGQEVDKVSYYQQCTDVICKIHEGIYFDRNGKQTTEIGYQESCVKHICEQFNGKYYDNNGKVTDYDSYKKACTKTYSYEYKKVTQAVPGYCAAWSNWKVKVLSSGSIPANTATYQAADLGTQKVQIGVIPGVPAQYEYKTVVNETLVQTGTRSYTVCDSIGYEVIGEQLYQVNSGWSSTGVTKSSYGSPASDSANTRWRAVGLDYDSCGSSCSNNPSITWQQQTRSVSAVNTVITVTPVCTSVGTKEVPVYAKKYSATTEKLLVKAAIPETPLYGNKHLYKESTCTNYVNPVPATTNYKWGKSSSDQTLISQGYVFTGKVVED